MINMNRILIFCYNVTWFFLQIKYVIFFFLIKNTSTFKIIGHDKNRFDNNILNVISRWLFYVWQQKIF